MPDNTDSHSKLRSTLFASKSGNSATDDESVDTDLPDTSAPYQAYSRAANKPLYTLHCWLGKDGYRSFQYVHLDSDASFKTDSAGQIIVLRFAGTHVMQVTIKGRQLWRLYDYLHQHRIAWIMRADRDLADGHEAIITEICIAPTELP